MELSTPHRQWSALSQSSDNDDRVILSPLQRLASSGVLLDPTDSLPLAHKSHVISDVAKQLVLDDKNNSRCNGKCEQMWALRLSKTTPVCSLSFHTKRGAFKTPSLNDLPRSVAVVGVVMPSMDPSLMLIECGRCGERSCGRSTMFCHSCGAAMLLLSSSPQPHRPAAI